MKLDLKSKKILYELDINARQSFSGIGKKVGLSKEMVNYRIKQMEKSGLIKGYYTILNISKLGYLNYRVFLKFYNVNPKKEKIIIDYLFKQPRVAWIMGVSGYWDMTLLVGVKNIFEFEKIWNNFMELYRNYIEKKDLSVVTHRILFRKAYLLDKKIDDSGVIIAGGQRDKRVDDIDFKILKIITLNSRAPILEISKKTKISPKVISYRIKKMIKNNVILSFRALLDISLLHMSHFKIHITLQKMTKEKEKQLFTYARFHPNIQQITSAVGGADFEIELYAKSNVQLHEIIDDIKDNFSDIIRKIDIMEFYKEYKRVYLPSGGKEDCSKKNP